MSDGARYAASLHACEAEEHTTQEAVAGRIALLSITMRCHVRTRGLDEAGIDQGREPGILGRHLQR
jgi:hypothetical protein